jgi:hypothetical protein
LVFPPSISQWVRASHPRAAAQQAFKSTWCSTAPTPRAEDWNLLFWALGERARTGRWLIILDEINWLGIRDPTFLGKLD